MDRTRADGLMLPGLYLDQAQDLIEKHRTLTRLHQYCHVVFDRCIIGESPREPRPFQSSRHK